MNAERHNATGIGSEFEWPGPLPGPRVLWPASARWYALGRTALIEALRHRLAADGVLHVPAYFCPDVVESLHDAGVATRSYEDDPQTEGPALDTLDARDGDAVLAVNFFGVRESTPWRDWRRRRPRVTLIEDHTHDPLSHWARTSEADFAFASLRKTLPAPDGAILWSPRKRELPASIDDGQWSGSALKLAAMIWKRDFQDAQEPDPALRKTYREFEIAGEGSLANHGGGGISPWSRAILQAGCPTARSAAREKNVKAFLELFRQANVDIQRVRSLFHDWPAGHCPFNPVLVMADSATREAVRLTLIDGAVYAPVHWSIPQSPEPNAQALSERILTIPLDYRCRTEWIPRIVEMITRCVADKPTRVAA